MTEVRLPKTGDAITEAVVVKFYVDNGAHIEEGDPLYLLETDKVEMDIPAPTSGIVTHVVEAGGEYPVGELLATIE